MVNLNEYIGSITSSLTEARMISDLKTLEIAEKFAKHDLLKHFSIPRFRAQNIELTIPMAIASLQQDEVIKHEPIDNIAFNSQTYQLLKNMSKADSFERKTSVLLRKKIAQKTDFLEKSLKSGVDKHSVMKEFSSSLTNDFLSISKENLDTIELAKKLEKVLIHSINDKKELKTKHTKVIVEASKLKEINPVNLIQVKMTLTEEGMEWHTIENDKGEKKSKLLPE